MKEESKVEELLEEFENTFSNKHSSPQGDCIQIIDETIPYIRFHVWLEKALTEATENARRKQNEKREEELTKHFGPKCDEYEENCMTCEMWKYWEEANTN